MSANLRLEGNFLELVKDLSYQQNSDEIFKAWARNFIKKETGTGAFL